MAEACAGVTAIWNGVTFGEVTEITVDAGGGLPLGRDSLFAVDAGTIQIACLATANISMASHGLKSTLNITGGGLTFTTKAICQSLQLAGKVNDVARYTASFKISKE